MKVDLKKDLDGYAARRGVFRVVELPPQRYLMVDGTGDPNTAPAFGRAIETLYPVAYRAKFASRRELDRDYVVPPLEGLWWSASMTAFTSAREKGLWNWTLMILTPEWVPAELVGALPEGVRLETLDEGLVVQTLHVGSFDDEAATLARLHDEFIPAEGLAMTGHHHEIYLSDFRRVEPARQRTILRQPVRRV